MSKIKVAFKNTKNESKPGCFTAGFTLLEVLVVIAITSFITTIVIIAFARSRTDIDRTVNIFVADIRAMQSKAISSARYESKVRCGFGFGYVDSSTYRLYAGADASDILISCSSENKNYDAPPAGHDAEISQVKLYNAALKILSPFPDIFFEPPKPKTYIDNVADLTAAPSRIIITTKDIANAGQCTFAANANKCRSICIYPSGKIELPGNAGCPAN